MAAATPALNVEEMRDLTSYLWAQQFFEDIGNASAGKRVFAAKHCATCHEDASSGAPNSRAPARRCSPGLPWSLHYGGTAPR